MNSKSLKQKLIRFFKGKQGGAVPTAIKVLTAVVCGAVIMMGLYGVVTGVVLPASSDKVNSMFSYEAEGGAGGSGGDGGYGGGTGDPTPIYTIVEGNGTVVDTTLATPLTFRSDAPYDTFESVKIDGVVIDSSNYTVTEGSTIVTFKSSYVANELSGGEHTIEIVSNGSSAEATFTADDSHIIPAGHIYSSMTTGTIVGDGSTVLFPETHDGTAEYITEAYIYSEQGDGWNVRLVDEPLAVYPVLYSHILGAPVLYMEGLFAGCTNMTVSPDVPDSIKYMTDAYSGCTSLITAPVIPTTVQCTEGLFDGCINLEGAVIVNANNLINIDRFFNGTIKSITLKGTCSRLAEIAAQYENVTVAE